MVPAIVAWSTGIVGQSEAPANQARKGALRGQHHCAISRACGGHCPGGSGNISTGCYAHARASWQSSVFVRQVLGRKVDRAKRNPRGAIQCSNQSEPKVITPSLHAIKGGHIVAVAQGLVLGVLGGHYEHL